MGLYLSLKRILWIKFLCVAIGITVLYGFLSAHFNTKEYQYTSVPHRMAFNNSTNFCQIETFSYESKKFLPKTAENFATFLGRNCALVYKRFRNLLVNKRFDTTRKYAIQDFAILGENMKNFGNWPQQAPCLATQGSLLYLRHIPYMVKQWQGLMSVAIFVPEVDFHLAVLSIENMRKCYLDVRNNVTFHFVYPLEYPATLSLEALDFDVENCSTWNLNLTQQNRFNSSKTLYPQNVLRNVARKSCATDYVLVIDIDMIPSRGLAPELETFLSRENVTKCNKCAYVVPAYETAENVSVPNNKSELIDLVHKKLARPYRKKAFNPNQAATNASVWENLPPGNNVSVGYRLPCFKFYYEPFYLAQDSVPPHDERFLGYGYTRNTQVYETQLAGYRFFVLDNAFITQHKMANAPNSLPSRTDQTTKNSRRFQKLQKEFSVKYKELKDLPCNMTDTN